MASGVVVQMLFPREALSANGAVVRFIGRVSLHVAFERRGVGEYVKTNRAREHRAAQMTLAVAGEVVRIRECFPANLR